MIKLETFEYMWDDSGKRPRAGDYGMRPESKPSHFEGCTVPCPYCERLMSAATNPPEVKILQVKSNGRLVCARFPPNLTLLHCRECDAYFTSPKETVERTAVSGKADGLRRFAPTLTDP